MRIRSIKPEFWRSHDITSLAIADRLLFIGLWSYVDDNGVGVDDEATIIGDIFARDMFGDPRETVARVTGGLSRLAAGGQIVRYTVDERRFLYVTAWDKHQRIDKPGKPRFPRPEADSSILATSSRDSRESVALGAGEQRNRGAEEQGAEEQASAAPLRTCHRHSSWDHSDACRRCGEDRRAFEAYDVERRPSTISEAPAACSKGHAFDAASGYCGRCGTRDDASGHVA